MVKVVVISKTKSAGSYITDVLSKLNGFSLVAHQTSFAKAVNQSSAGIFDVVLIDVNLSEDQEFEVATTLLSTNGIRWVTFDHPENKIQTQSLNIRRRSGLFPLPNQISPKSLERTLRIVTNTLTHQAHRPKEYHTPETGSYDRFVMIGSSTGGIDALINILSSFPKVCPPTVIVQHTKPAYLPNLAKLLATKCEASVSLACDGSILEPGKIMLAMGEAQNTVISKRSGRFVCRLKVAPEQQTHVPSISALFTSAAQFGSQCIGVLLTGMGADGSLALGDMKRTGASTIVQDEMTSVVYGMPKVAWESGSADYKLPIQDIGPKVLELAAHRVSQFGVGAL